MAIQNTCPATWVNSSIVPNQSPFQAYPIPAPVDRIAGIRDTLEKSGVLISRIAKRLSGPTPIAFSVGNVVVTGLVIWKAGTYVAEATVEVATKAPVETWIAGVGLLSVVLFLVVRNAAGVAGGAAGALPGPPRMTG